MCHLGARRKCTSCPSTQVFYLGLFCAQRYFGRDVCMTMEQIRDGESKLQSCYSQLQCYMIISVFSFCFDIPLFSIDITLIIHRKYKSLALPRRCLGTCRCQVEPDCLPHQELFQILLLILDYLQLACNRSKVRSLILVASLAPQADMHFSLFWFMFLLFMCPRTVQGRYGSQQERYIFFFPVDFLIIIHHENVQAPFIIYQCFVDEYGSYRNPSALLCSNPV